MRALIFGTPTHQRVTPAKVERCFVFLRDRIAETAVTPSYEEMRLALGFHSKRSIHKIIAILEAEGRIRRIPGKARAIEIVNVAKRRVPVLDTTRGGWRFFRVDKASPDTDARLVEMVVPKK